MKKHLIAAMAATLLLGAVAAHAQDNMGGLGFRTLSSPAGVAPALGIRQWFGPQLGMDLAVGFTTGSTEQGPPTVTTTEASGIVFDGGLPWSVKKWDRVNFIVRPGFQYARTTQENKQNPIPPNKVTLTGFAVTGELEVEYMFVDKVSISASHGVAYRSIKLHDNDTPENEQKFTEFETVGSNFTQLGLHVYLW